MGDKTSFERVVTSNDIIKFAEISGDYNPLHTEGGVVHGMFMAALISRLIGMDLPGRHSLLLKESLDFKKPARIGDKLKISGQVIFKSVATGIIELKVEIHNKKDLLVLGIVYVKVLK